MTETLKEMILGLQNQRIRRSLLEEYEIVKEPATIDGLIELFLGPTPLGEDSSARKLLTSLDLPEACFLLADRLGTVNDPQKREYSYIVIDEQCRRGTRTVADRVRDLLVTEVRKDILNLQQSKRDDQDLLDAAVFALATNAIYARPPFSLPGDFPSLSQEQFNGFMRNWTNLLSNISIMGNPGYLEHMWAVIGIVLYSDELGPLRPKV